MANIPGIVGYVGPGAFSLVETRPGPVSLPGGPTVIAILGQGRREQALVARAAGGGKDGLPVKFDPANSPDGRHFQTAVRPVVPGTIEVFINPVGDGTDLPLIQITSQAMADAWNAEFTDQDGYGYFQFQGPNGDSVDGYQAASDGTGFFNSKYARQFAALKQRLGITAGSPEPNHYLFDPATGRIVLDQPLRAFDTLIVSYIAESDLNDPELMFSLKDVVAKHGFPSKMNTISLAAQMAFENGAGVIMPVHAGQVLQGEGSAKRLVAEPTLFTALKSLEKEELVEIIVPVLQSRVFDEVIMPFYDPLVHGTLTDNGRFLQESEDTGDQPGINISPLAVNSTNDAPAFLEVFKNGRKLEYGVDYSVVNLDGSQAGPDDSQNVLIALDPTYSGATHSVDNTLQEGDRITASYLPDPAVINLVATSQLAVLQHCNLMSETKNRLERTCLFGAYEFVDLDFILNPVTGIDANFGSFYRCMFFYPGGSSVTRVVAGEAQRLDAQFIAACAAGFVASRPIPTPLTNKILQGFTINPRQKLNNDETNLIGGAGCSIITPLAAGGKVLHGRTTTNSGSAVEEEYSIIRIRDHVAKTVRRALENAFIGRLITPSTADDVASTTKNILEALVSQGILSGFQSVAASVNPQEPRQIDVQFDIRPVFPLNWIFIRFTVGS